MKVGDYVRVKGRKLKTAIPAGLPAPIQKTIINDMVGIVVEDRSPFFRIKWLTGMKLIDESLISYRELNVLPDEEAVFLRLKGVL